ncbi:MAG: hypothetical protein M9894_37325 [Planctomycetes bacterium]|nr:hypothetical protein [Planctomycetota bacterium]
MAAARTAEALQAAQQALEARLAEAQAGLRAQDDLLMLLADGGPEAHPLALLAVTPEGALRPADAPLALGGAAGARVVLSAEPSPALRAALDAAAEERVLLGVEVRLEGASAPGLRLAATALQGEELPFEGWRALPALLAQEAVHAWVEPFDAASLLRRGGALAVLLEPEGDAPACRVVEARLVVTPLRDDVKRRLRLAR